MGPLWSGEEKKWRQNIDGEMRNQREQSQTDNQRHREEMNQRHEEMQQAEQRYREELERMERAVALERKIGQKRIKLLNKIPGGSDNFPKDVKAPTRLFLSLFGETGIGKTSLINSLKYTIKGGLKIHQRIQSAPQNCLGGHTVESLEVVLTDHLSVIDNPGINSEKAGNAIQQDDVIRRMEGRYKKGTVTWQSLAPAHENEEDKKSYCSVMVFSAHNANVARQYQPFIRRLRDWQGWFPLAVITHVDEASPVDVRMALQSVGIESIYEVANITSGEKGRDSLSPEDELQLIQLVEKCFMDGDLIFLRRQEFESKK